MPKIQLQHKGKPVSIEVAPDGDKVRNYAPLRFRIGHDVTVNTGVSTWFMSRAQVDELSLEVLTEILEAKEPGFEKVIENAESRVSFGQRTLVRSVREVSHLTHPDVLMLIDMRQNPNEYVNGTSAFAAAFNALARKVMDLSFYATLYGVYPDASRKDYIKLTGAVTRGMDQFIYCRPNASAASPYVNFSVIPAEANYEDVRFPTYYNTRTGEKEKIPKTSFREHYVFYVNELFGVYRRYLKQLLASSVEPGNEAQVNADILLQAPGDGPGEGGEGATAVIKRIEAEQIAEQQANAEAEYRKQEQEQAEQEARQERKDRKAAKKAKKSAKRREIIEEAVTEALNEFRQKVKSQRAKAVKREDSPPRMEEYEPEDKPQREGKPSLGSLEVNPLDIAVEALYAKRSQYSSARSWSSGIKAQRALMKTRGLEVPSYDQIKAALRDREVLYLD